MVHHGLTFFNFIGSALLADRFHHHRWLTWLTCQTLQGQHIKMVNPVWPKDGGFGPIIPRSYCNSCETWIFPKACSKKFGVSNCWLNRFRKQMNSMTKTSEVFQEVTFLSYPADTFILGGYTSQNKEKCVSACWNRIDVVKKKNFKAQRKYDCRVTSRQSCILFCAKSPWENSSRTIYLSGAISQRLNDLVEI